MEVYTFNPNNAPVRVQVINGEPWFVAKDICDALSIENNRNATARLDDDEKGVSIVRTPSGDQQMSVVKESGLYNLIFQSRKAEARAFRKWVTGEVLPTIRRTGRYELKRKTEVVRRRRRADVDAETLGLLWLIGESLWHGDQKAVAMELGVSVQSVNMVLNGYMRSPRILMALYAKARERREQDSLYTSPGEMAQRLLDSGTGMLEKAGVGRVEPGKPMDTQRFGKEGGAR